MSQPKKIKLITFAPHPNFGTCLQSYALNYVLRKMGHDVEFIYNCRGDVKPESNKHKIIRWIKSFIKLFIPKSYLAKRKLRKKKEEEERQKQGIMRDPEILTLPNNWPLYLFSKLPCYDKWWKKHMCINLQWQKVFKFTYEDGNFKMRRIFTHRQYHEVTADTDLFITGSDQIWSPYCMGFNPMMFVEFGEDKKRIAYSSSIAQPELPKLVEQRMKEDLMKFSHIGVREKRSVELLNALMNRTDVRLVVDPTYLLTREEWSEFGKRAQIEFPVPEKYIFCYLAGARKKEFKQMVEEVKALTGITEVIDLECGNRIDNYLGGRHYMDAGPYEWVYLLEHSSYVCMDSFHATVFALKFQKDFVHIMKNSDTETGSQNTRMYDLLSRYGILRKNYVPGNKGEWKVPVDYSKITPFIEEEIKDSMAFLRYEIEN